MNIHTPGPWIMTEQGEDDLVVCAERGDFICRPSGATFGEAIDNARLIAAAPDMLSALRLGLMVMIGYTHRNEAIDNAIKVMSDAIQQATQP